MSTNNAPANGTPDEKGMSLFTKCVLLASFTVGIFVPTFLWAWTMSQNYTVSYMERLHKAEIKQLKESYREELANKGN